MDQTSAPLARQLIDCLREEREVDGVRLLRDALTDTPENDERARLERILGLLLIRCGREVEGTFALERAETRLDTLGLPYPTLESFLQLAGF